MAQAAQAKSPGITAVVRRVGTQVITGHRRVAVLRRLAVVARQQFHAPQHVQPVAGVGRVELQLPGNRQGAARHLQQIEQLPVQGDTQCIGANRRQGQIPVRLQGMRGCQVDRIHRAQLILVIAQSS
ncbi:hypothetical protein D3C85_1562710 [compost metagenome]